MVRIVDYGQFPLVSILWTPWYHHGFSTKGIAGGSAAWPGFPEMAPQAWTAGLRVSWDHWRKLVAVAESGSRGSAS